MAKYSLSFDHLLRDRTVESSYRLIEEWLRSEGAQIRVASPPNLIEASHGRALQSMGWKADAKKRISFWLTRRGYDTFVRVTVTPAFGNVSDVMSFEDEARANWSELLAGLWARLGEYHAKREAVAALGIDWNWRMQKGKETMIGGVIFLLVGFVLMAFFMRTGPVVYTAVMTTGALLIVNGWMVYRLARKRVMAQRQPVVSHLSRR